MLQSLNKLNFYSKSPNNNDLRKNKRYNYRSSIFGSTFKSGKNYSVVRTAFGKDGEEIINRVKNMPATKKNIIAGVGLAAIAAICFL